MGTLVVLSVSIVVLVFVTKFLVGRNRVRELDRDFSLELSCTRERALSVAASAARGVMWHVEFTENGLYTRHIFARNVIHVAVSGHPARPGRCTAKVWTRVRLADDGVFFLRAKSYLDTKRKRDKVVRFLSTYGATTGGRDATIG
ncbi:hypothetical protein [Actinophytocola sp.]|jgi:hypothetical protein|uniref:hypothetical protein n=1 Tax=Actinophytocola sp. TaxID=1872138 RepID=UPI002EDB3787